jgi:RTX calcium-binding nonapeptide repeat (4 copies)
MRMLRWVMLVVGVAAVCAGAGSVLVSPAVAGNVKTGTNSKRIQTAKQHAGSGAPINVCGNTQLGNTCANARDQLAKMLRKRDPGKRVGGRTLVGTRTEAVLRGARGRINFMMALGDRETLIGGQGHDELGVYPGTRGVRINGRGGPDLIHGMGLAQHISGGAGNDLIYGGPGNDTIRGGAGNDAIYGGPGNDTIYGGGGNDRIIDHRGATTVITGPGRARVDVRDGQPNDRVSCPHGSQTRVVADHNDRLSAGCRRVSATAVTSPVTGSPATLSTAGDGSWANPYSTTCGPSSVGNCVETFPARALKGLWANEYVPSYECPFDNSDFGAARVYLIAYNYAPRGTTVPNGVEILGLGPIGVSITLTGPGENQANPNPSLVNMAGQTGTGFGNSSATNWTTGTKSYTPNLHCTYDPDQGYLTLG